VTSFVGTATGFDTNPVFSGPVTLGQGAGGPTFLPNIDNKFSTTPNYFSTGGNGVGGGLGLVTAAGYNFRTYDYTDAYHDYGVQTGWFVSSGYNPTSVSFNAVPEPATWALMALGFFGLGAAGYASRRRQAVAVV
jgi:PEP-CTERM motif